VNHASGNAFDSTHHVSTKLPAVSATAWPWLDRPNRSTCYVLGERYCHKGLTKDIDAFIAVIVVASKACYRQTGGVGPLRNPSCTERPVGSGTARGAATRLVSTMQSKRWSAITWLQVLGQWNRSQSAFVLCSQRALNATGGQTRMQPDGPLG